MKKLKWNGIVFKLYDNAGGSYWRARICTHCVRKHNVPAEMLEECDGGLCDVFGCHDYADYYIYIPFSETGWE